MAIQTIFSQECERLLSILARVLRKLLLPQGGERLQHCFLHRKENCFCIREVFMYKLLPICGVLLMLSVGFSGCSGSSTLTPIQATAVRVHITDPTTCSVRNHGSFRNVFVTISDVRIHTNPTAGSNDGGWVDLTPNLSKSPVQVDLLALTDNTCFLATLGDVTEIQPGTYQQIRLILADTSQSANIVGGNKCPAGTGVNCVLPATGSPMPLQLSSELQTGIKIPSGQIAGGKFTVTAGQTVDLDIDFDTCRSIVLQGNSQARLKPVLHAGEVSLQNNSINGTVVDNATGQPILGTVMVMLAQPGPGCSGVGCVSNAAMEDVKMSTMADASGNFIFCPVSPGTYDVIAVAATGNTVYAPTITSGVQPGNTLSGNNKIKLINAGAQGTIKGTVTTTSTTNTAIAEQDITVMPLQPFSIGGTNLLLEIPMFGGNSTVTTVNTTVTNPNTCSSNSVGCGNYALLVPGANPNVGVFNPVGTNFTQIAGAASYIVYAQASSCSPSEEQTNQQQNPPGGTLTVTAGGTATASTLTFSSCQ
jgi:hypothetical protein